MAWIQTVIKSERAQVLAAAVMLSLALTAIVFSAFLTRSGVANEGDLTWAYFKEPGLTGLYRESSQLGLLPNQMIIYSWMFYLPLDPAIMERILFMGTFLLMGTICYYVSFMLLRHEGAERRLAHIISGAATTAYVFCPMNLYHITALFLLIGYALLPALIYVALRFAWSRRSRKDILLYGALTGAVLAASSGDPRWPIWGLLVLVLLMFIMAAMDRFKGLPRAAGYLTVAVASFTALSAFWFLPTLLVPDHATLLARPNLSVPFFYALNKYSIISNALIFQADFWEPTRSLFLLRDPVLNFLFHISQWALPALAALSILFYRQNRQVVPLMAISAVIIVIATAPMSPFQFIRDGYQGFVFDLPFGIAFRTAYKWLALLTFPLVMLAAYSILGLSKGMELYRSSHQWRGASIRMISKYASIVLVAILAASSLFATWPMLAGNFGGLISPTDLSGDYREAYDLIQADIGGDSSFKILYLPSNPYTGFSAPGLTDSPYLHYIMTLLERGNLTHMGHHLAPLGARYVMIDKTAYTNKALENALRNQTDLPIKYEGEQLLVFENEQVSSLFRFSDPAVNFDGIDSGASRIAWEDWIQTDQAIMGLSEVFDRTPYVIMGPGYPYDLMSADSTISSPYLYVPYCNDDAWQFQTIYAPSAVGTHITGSYEWIGLLGSLGLENWNLDFGMGIAFVDKNLTIPKDMPLPDSALVEDFDLSDRGAVQEFVGNNYPEQFDAKQVLSWDGDSMRVKLLNSTPGWKTVRSPMVEVSYGQTYIVTTEIRSHSGFDIHFKIAEHDQDGNITSVRSYYGLGSGEIDRTPVRLSYKANNTDVKYISLQIWHGSDTTMPLPNTFWVNHVSFYNATELLRPPQLDGKVKVGDSGRYRMYVRTLDSPLGGNMTLTVDGTTHIIETRSDDTTMSWTFLGTLDLAAGEHGVTVRNIDGTNAVNIISLIGEDEYAERLSHYSSQLEDKALVYVLKVPAESVSIALNDDPFLGPTDQYLVAKKEIEVHRAGHYRIYANSSTSSSLYIDGVLNGEMDGADRYLSVDLGTGRHRIALFSTGPSYVAGEIIMFSANAGSDIASLDGFSEVGEQTMDVTRKGTSTYYLDVAVGRSTLLVFSHAFDSGWTLTSGSTSIYSVPVNTAENGFMIGIDGNASLIITYSPDRLYVLGGAISLASAAIMSVPALMCFVWRKRSNGPYRL